MHVAHCPDCPYRAHGSAIGSRGDPASRFVLVGEAPGSVEVEVGEPFRGPAGRVLGEALAEAGIREADVLIVNSISCQPHPVHPTVAAIRSCRGRLIEEVGAHPRSVIVALGATAIRALTDRAGFAVMRDHGQVIPSAWGAIIPTLHPARVLRVRSERPLLVADLTAARHLAEGQAS